MVRKIYSFLQFLIPLMAGLLVSGAAYSQTPKESVMGVNVVVNFKVRPARLDSFMDLMKTVKAGLPQVPGCKSVKIYQDANDPLAFTLVEAWDSKDTHARHVKGLQDSGQWAAIAEHLAAEPVSSYFQEL